MTLNYDNPQNILSLAQTFADISAFNNKKISHKNNLSRD